MFGARELGAWGLTQADLEEGRQPIALCEAAMLPLALFADHATFRGRDVLWVVDNTSALHSFVRGTSGNKYLEEIVAVYWFAAFELKCRIWLEWVDSDANWSDGISRLLGEDELSAELGFRTCLLEDQMAWWHEDPTLLWGRVQERLDKHVGRAQ